MAERKARVMPIALMVFGVKPILWAVFAGVVSICWIFCFSFVSMVWFLWCYFWVFVI